MRPVIVRVKGTFRRTRVPFIVVRENWTAFLNLIAKYLLLLVFRAAGLKWVSFLVILVDRLTVKTNLNLLLSPLKLAPRRVNSPGVIPADRTLSHDSFLLTLPLMIIVHRLIHRRNKIVLRKFSGRRTRRRRRSPTRSRGELAVLVILVVVRFIGKRKSIHRSLIIKLLLTLMNLFSRKLLIMIVLVLYNSSVPKTRVSATLTRKVVLLFPRIRLKRSNRQFKPVRTLRVKILLLKFSIVFRKITRVVRFSVLFRRTCRRHLTVLNLLLPLLTVYFRVTLPWRTGLNLIVLPLFPVKFLKTFVVIPSYQFSSLTVGQRFFQKTFQFRWRPNCRLIYWTAFRVTRFRWCRTTVSSTRFSVPVLVIPLLCCRLILIKCLTLGGDVRRWWFALNVVPWRTRVTVFPFPVIHFLWNLKLKFRLSKRLILVRRQIKVPVVVNQKTVQVVIVLLILLFMAWRLKTFLVSFPQRRVVVSMLFQRTPVKVGILVTWNRRRQVFVRWWRVAWNRVVVRKPRVRVIRLRRWAFRGRRSSRGKRVIGVSRHRRVSLMTSQGKGQLRVKFLRWSSRCQPWETRRQFTVVTVLILFLLLLDLIYLVVSLFRFTFLIGYFLLRPVTGRSFRALVKAPSKTYKLYLSRFTRQRYFYLSLKTPFTCFFVRSSGPISSIVSAIVS